MLGLLQLVKVSGIDIKPRMPTHINIRPINAVLNRYLIKTLLFAVDLAADCRVPFVKLLKQEICLNVFQYF